MMLKKVWSAPVSPDFIIGLRYLNYWVIPERGCLMRLFTCYIRQLEPMSIIYLTSYP